MTIEKISEKLANCELMLWKWSTNKEGFHPVKIRVTYNRKSKYYSVEHASEKVFLSPDQYEAVSGKSPRGNNRAIAEALAGSLLEAKKAIRLTCSNGRQFTFDKFEKNYINKTVSGGFFIYFRNYLDELLVEGRTGSYVAYKNALSALKAFREDKDINPAEITVSFLKAFEAFLRMKKTGVTKRGKKIVRSAGSTTVAMYMRAVKVVYNIVADQHPELKSEYPFATKQNDRNKYQIPAGSGQHKGEVLSTETLKDFIAAETEEGTPEHTAKLYFLFSFYAQGMNFRDVANLKYHHIKGNAIKYVREKTKRTTKGDKQTMIEVPLNDELNKILVELSTLKKNPDNYVFPILSYEMSAIQQDKAVRQFIKITNKWIKSLCTNNGIPVFTSYSARHSYASLLKQAGESVELIRELLGHSDIATTENYLKRFDIDTKQKANDGIFKVLKSA